MQFTPISRPELNINIPALIYSNLDLNIIKYYGKNESFFSITKFSEVFFQQYNSNKRHSVEMANETVSLFCLL